jgi:hypothetical protein
VKLLRINRQKSVSKPVIAAALPLAFTVAPHLQTINHRGCFSPFVGIWSGLAIPHQG